MGIVLSWCEEQKAMLHKYFKKNKKIKIFFICVILENCTILVNLGPLLLNIGLYMSIVYMLDFSPKCVV